MVTENPLDLTPTGSMVSSIGPFFYWALAAPWGILPQQFDEADHLNGGAGTGRTGSSERAANEAAFLPESIP